MPLPTPPLKRAALLSVKDYDAPTKAQPKVSVTEAVVTQATAPNLAHSTQSITKLANTEEKTPVLKKTSPVLSNKTSRPTKNEPTTPTNTPSKTATTKTKHTGPTKLFVLDTNVLLHDPMCLFRFEEHDIFLPMIVLEELDAHKKGMTEVARNARRGIRETTSVKGCL
jgi:PhoH-like ATPase